MTDVDGVPCLQLAVPGPLRMGLCFRVGFVDEPLPVRGITHFVEHLALGDVVDEVDHSANGQVELWRTLFFGTGTPAKLKTYLGDLTRALSDLPLDRLERERSIIGVEAQRRGGSVVSSLLQLRYGAVGLGVSNFRELGVPWLDGQRLRAWAAGRMTRQNAVLWCSGPVPRGLHLELADGLPAPPPDVPTLPVALPAQGEGLPGGVALGLLLPTGPLLQVLSTALQRRGLDLLRREMGVSYVVDVDVVRATSGQAHVTLYADAPDARAGEALSALVRVVEELAEQGPTAEEVAFVRSGFAATLAEPGTGVGRLDAAARRLLGRLGEDVGAVVDDELAELRALLGLRTTSVRGAAEAMQAARRTMLAVAPPGTGLVDGLQASPGATGGEVAGRRFRSLYRPESGRSPLRPRAKFELFVGADAVGLRDPAGLWRTVRYDDVVLVEWSLAGDRVLLARDGTALTVDGDVWDDGAAAVALLDERLAPALRVPRDPVQRRPGELVAALAPTGTRQQDGAAQ